MIILGGTRIMSSFKLYELEKVLKNITPGEFSKAGAMR